MRGWLGKSSADREKLEQVWEGLTSRFGDLLRPPYSCLHCVFSYAAVSSTHPTQANLS